MPKFEKQPIYNGIGRLEDFQRRITAGIKSGEIEPTLPVFGVYGQTTEEQVRIFQEQYNAAAEQLGLDEHAPFGRIPVSEPVQNDRRRG